VTVFTPRSYPTIVGEMISRLISATPLSDVNYGSVFTTMLEAAAQEDAEAYFQMLSIIAGYSIDSVSGVDLDNKAFEYGITRLPPLRASADLTFYDSAVVKVATVVFPGLPGPVANATAVNGSSATGFPNSGRIIIGRGTTNSESVDYSSITDNKTYYTFVLSQSLAKDHGTDEAIVLSQGGDRVIVAGTVVKAPASDVTAEVSFSVTNNTIILDGESSVSSLASALELGSGSNVPVGAISQFESLPFATAKVRNPTRIVNGADAETDAELQDRIKNTIQSLSRGTKKAIINGVLNVSSGTQRVVSANIEEPVVPAGIVKLYIDDGSGFIPNWQGADYETLAQATGGEKYLKSKQFPIVKANSETLNDGPWDLTLAPTVKIQVGAGPIETFTFLSTQFADIRKATPSEVVIALNSSSNFESRLSTETKVKVFAKSWDIDSIQVTDNIILNFQPEVKETTRLYLTRQNKTTLLIMNVDYKLNRFVGQFELTNPLLAGDVLTIGTYKTKAFVESAGGGPFALSGGETLDIEIDTVLQTATFQVSDFALPGAATASEIVARMNKDYVGATANIVLGVIQISSDSLKAGSLKVIASVTNTILGFPTTQVDGIESLVAIMESDDGPYTFSTTDFVVFSYNGTTSVSANCFYKGIVSSATATTISDINLSLIFPDNAQLDGNYEVVSGADRISIASYNRFSNTITLLGALAIVPSASDEYFILPKNANALVDFWKNPGITSMSYSLDVSTCKGGAAVQVSTKTGGSISTLEAVTTPAVLNFPLQKIISGTNAYSYYTGLVQEVQWVVDGLDEDWDNYPGLRAAGIQVEVIEPVIKFQDISLVIVTKDLSIGPSVNNIKAAVTGYINTLPIGGDVLLSEIIRRVKNEVSSVLDVKITSPVTNIVVAYNELAKTTESRVIVG